MPKRHPRYLFTSALCRGHEDTLSIGGQNPHGRNNFYFHNMTSDYEDDLYIDDNYLAPLHCQHVVVVVVLSVVKTFSTLGSSMNQTQPRLDLAQGQQSLELLVCP